MSDRTPFKPDIEPELTPKGIDVNRIEGLTYLDYSSYHRMCDFLHISDQDRRDPKIAEKISYITDWAAAVTKSNKELMHKKQIKNLIRDLGESHVGIDLLDTINRFARLDKERRNIEDEMSLYKPIAEEKPKPKKRSKPKKKELEEQEPERIAEEISQQEPDQKDLLIGYFLGGE